MAAVDNHPLSAETYRLNHPEVRVWCQDISTLSASLVKRKLQLQAGRLDLLAGCPPCQAFSSIRTLNGKRVFNDPGKDLIFELLRFVKTLKPRAIMIENVPGLARDQRTVRFCALLDCLGYRSEVRVLDAARYGVPQRRRRMVLLAIKGIAPRFGKSSLRTKTVKDCIGRLPEAGSSGDPLHDFPEKRSPTIMEMLKLVPADGGSREDLPDAFQLACHRKCDGFKDVYGRMSWNSVSPTITTGCFNPSKGRFLHPADDRAITMREAALLQGFPRTYHFPSTKGKVAVAEMIGNAVPPPFVAVHARQIRKILSTAAVGK